MGNLAVDVCCRAFDNLRDVRGLEYELDFVTNRASRDLQVCPSCFCPHDNADLGCACSSSTSMKAGKTVPCDWSHPLSKCLHFLCRSPVRSEMQHAEAGWLAVEPVRCAAHVIVARKGLAGMQVVREKAAAQAQAFQNERDQLVAELAKARGKSGVGGHRGGKSPLASKENVRA